MKNNLKLWSVSFLVALLGCLAMIVLLFAYVLIRDWIRVVVQAIMENTPPIFCLGSLFVLSLAFVRFSGFGEAVVEHFTNKKEE